MMVNDGYIGVSSGNLTVCELENGPVEIVDLPSYKMVMFSGFTYWK